MSRTGGAIIDWLDCQTRLVRAGYQRYASYRLASFAGLVSNVVFALIRVAILLAALQQRPNIGGYDAAAIVTYVWLGQGLYSVVLLWGDSELAERVRTGDVSIDLSRPWDLQMALLSADLGRAAYAVPFRLLPPVLLGALLFPFRWPDRPVTWLLFGCSMLLAVVVSFATRFIVNLGTFWMMEIRGLGTLYGIVGGVLSGLTLPLAFFPEQVRTLLWCTPFPAMLQAPIDVFNERGSALTLLGIQAMTALVLLAIGRVVLARAHRRLVVQGG